ncbi:MAG: hypothetical protein EPO65_04640 [Dehalococcoidia bacterium]|nr:MAG: hypothetical protein EPO65_04640 [Dehalococcoidia bacterium]
MTAPLPLDEIIDRCIEDIRSGHATVDDCLTRYPAHRAELEPLLSAVASMSALPRGEMATPDPGRRAAFMAALRETPQDRPRRIRMPSLATLLGGGAFRIVGPAFALAALAVAIVLGQGATPANASTLTIFDGGVERLDHAEWKPMRDGDRLEAGARMRTGLGGRAMLTFPDGSTIALDPTTELTIETLAVAPRRIEVRQSSGRLWHDIVHDESEGSRFVVLTPDTRVEVLGTVFQTSVDASTGQTDVSTADGEVRVITGNNAVPVGRGEALRARRAAIESVSAAPFLDSALVVSGPFASAIIAADGRGTGIRVDGVTFRQLRGITTSTEDQVQRFDLQDIDPGAYTLVLQRRGDGSGEIVLDTPGGQQQFTVDGTAKVVRLPMRLEVRAGLPVLVAGNLQSASDTPATVRIAESERTRAAVEQATATARTSPAAAKTPTPNATTKPRTQQSPAASTTAKPGEQKTPTVKPGTATAAATQAPLRTVTPTPTRTATPDPAVTAYTQRLRNAVASGKNDDIRSALNEALAGDNVTLRRQRVAVIAAALENETNAQRLASLFVNGQNASLRDNLRSALSANGGTGRARFEAAIVAAEARRLKQQTEQRSITPTPTQTGTPRPPTPPSPTPTGTPTGTPTVRPSVTPTATATAGAR